MDLTGYRKLIVSCLGIGALATMSIFHVIDGQTAFDGIAAIVGAFTVGNLAERKMDNTAAKIAATVPPTTEAGK